MLKLSVPAATAFLHYVVKNPNTLYSVYDRLTYGPGATEQLYNSLTGTEMSYPQAIVTAIGEDKYSMKSMVTFR